MCLNKGGLEIERATFTFTARDFVSQMVTRCDTPLTAAARFVLPLMSCDGVYRFLITVVIIFKLPSYFIHNEATHGGILAF